LTGITKNPGKRRGLGNVTILKFGITLNMSLEPAALLAVSNYVQIKTANIKYKNIGIKIFR